MSSVVGNATASRGLEVAVANLQDYCNGIVIFVNCFDYLKYFVVRQLS